MKEHYVVVYHCLESTFGSIEVQIKTVDYSLRLTQ